MPTWVLTGANRGLGLEFVRQLAQDKENVVFAGIRESNTDTADLKKAIGDSGSSNVDVLICDTSKQDSTYAFAEQVTKKVGSGKIDFLLNIAGINADPDLKVLSQDSSSSVPRTGLTSEIITEHMDINVLGLATLAAALDPLLKDGSVVMNMTSGLASFEITKNMKPRKCAIYSISKAAVNMLNLHLDSEWKTKGKNVITIVMDPGWVKTRMGGEGAEIDADLSISSMLKVLRGLKSADSGKFYHYTGSEISW